MGIAKKKTKIVTMVANLLKIDEPMYVSLVDHGANRMPFKIIKNEKGSDQMGQMIVQSILMPNGLNIDDLVKSTGWINDLDLSKSNEENGYQRFHQIPISKFEANSLVMAKISDAVWAVVGDIKKGEKVANPVALPIGVQKVTKASNEIIAPKDTVIAEQQRDPIPITFEQMFEDELYTFLNVARGALSQSQSDPAKRRKIIMGALDNFKSFVLMGLDLISGKGEASKGDTDALTNKLKTISIKGGDNMSMDELFKTKEEFTSAVAEVVSTILDTKQKAEDTQKAILAEKAEKERLALTMAEVAKKMEDMNTVIETIQKSQKEMGNQLGTVPGGTKGTEDETLAKTEKTKTEKSVYSGCLTGGIPIGRA